MYKTNKIEKSFVKKTFERINTLANASDDVIIQTFDNIEKDLDIDMTTYKNIYLKISLIELDFIKKYGKKVKKVEFNFDEEFEIAVTEEGYTNPVFINKLKNLTSKHFNNLLKLLPNKNAMRILKTAITLSIMMVGMPSVSFANGFITKVGVLFDGTKLIASVVMFMFMTVDLIQNGVKKDSAVVWQIMLKYIMLMVALLSYKTIFRLIDEFFNEI